ncbi:Carbamoyl-phosphate synthase L chain ATP-binding protein [Dehalogenimonas lykanthroporepellens BL-DC-9]|nr:Carbamoyl-phosphate synthase L chain ATP-binding protein [Dehalogenimonas lykanthroporepellens BL-DC-9]
MISKILVANRGEIAVRVMRACRELGINTVAVYSEADKDAFFAFYADEAYLLGPAPATLSYLNIDKIIEIAKTSGAEAIHPGYGFLSENPTFAQACEKAGIAFIGPPARVLELTGNKITAREEAVKAGVPIIPGTGECPADFSALQDELGDIGYPLIVKPAGGGGGIGMVIARNDGDLQRALSSSPEMANKYFGISTIYIEKYIEKPRHIEFQILADTKGNVIHLGERECSIQRFHSKVIEEAPSTALTPEIREKMGQAAVDLARGIGYVGAGTIEFIYSEGNYYFLEVNARIQVEHAVTEMITGIDLVKEQINIATGLELSLKQEDVEHNGWAIECRINAEDPLRNFLPSPGTITGYRSPGGIGIRVDSGVHQGYTIPDCYHPMISKLIVWERNRTDAIKRMRRALSEYIIVGVDTNIALHKAIMENPRFVSGDLDTDFIARELSLLADMQKVRERDTEAQSRMSRIFQ